MNITFTIPDAIAPTVIDNICTATNYDPDSGKSKPQWAREKVIEHIKRLNSTGAQKSAFLAANSQVTANPIT